jgi:uncharacterized membrane protein YhaH (DUF805 family)
MVFLNINLFGEIMPLLDFFFSFQGRVRRSHYWYYMIGSNLAYIVLLFLLAIIASDGEEALMDGVSIVLGLLMMISGLAVMTRRWHDRDKSGWWSLILLIPIVGTIYSFIECGFFDGTPGSNRYGPSPKAVSNSLETQWEYR